MVTALHQLMMNHDKSEVFRRILELQVRVFGDRELDVISGFLGSANEQKLHRIVDIGCASGGFTNALAKRFSSAHVLGLDHDPKLLSARSLPQRENISFIECDAFGDDLAQHVCDADFVLIRFALQHLKNYKELLRKIVATMKSGAHLFAIEGIFAEHREDIEGGPYNDCINSLMQHYDKLGSDYRMSTKLPGEFKEAGLLDVEQRKAVHGYWNTDRDEFMALILSYAIIIHKATPDCMTKELIAKLEDYMLKNPQAKMYLTTSVTNGIKQ